MSEASDSEEENQIIKCSGNYGGISGASKFWDDLEDLGEETLKKSKITKIKIYTGKLKEKQVIMGISTTYKNLITGEEKTYDHKASKDVDDLKELIITSGEYLTDFYIRFPNEADYITQLGYGTNKKKQALLGTEEGENKTILTNGGDNIIVGTFGCLNEKLDATGIYFITKKDGVKLSLYPIFMLKYLIKKDPKFKENFEKRYNELSQEGKYIWKTVNLPDAIFSEILKYCYL